MFWQLLVLLGAALLCDAQFAYPAVGSFGHAFGASFANPYAAVSSALQPYNPYQALGLASPFSSPLVGNPSVTPLQNEHVKPVMVRPINPETGETLQTNQNYINQIVRYLSQPAVSSNPILGYTGNVPGLTPIPAPFAFGSAVSPFQGLQGHVTPFHGLQGLAPLQGLQGFASYQGLHAMPAPLTSYGAVPLQAPMPQPLSSTVLQYQPAGPVMPGLPITMQPPFAPPPSLPPIPVMPGYPMPGYPMPPYPPPPPPPVPMPLPYPYPAYGGPPVHMPMPMSSLSPMPAAMPMSAAMPMPAAMPMAAPLPYPAPGVIQPMPMPMPVPPPPPPPGVPLPGYPVPQPLPPYPLPLPPGMHPLTGYQGLPGGVVPLTGPQPPIVVPASPLPAPPTLYPGPMSLLPPVQPGFGAIAGYASPVMGPAVAHPAMLPPMPVLPGYPSYGFGGYGMYGYPGYGMASHPFVPIPGYLRYPTPEAGTTTGSTKAP